MAEFGIRDERRPRFGAAGGRRLSLLTALFVVVLGAQPGDATGEGCQPRAIDLLELETWRVVADGQFGYALTWGTRELVRLDLRDPARPIAIPVTPQIRAADVAMTKRAVVTAELGGGSVSTWKIDAAGRAKRLANIASSVKWETKAIQAVDEDTVAEVGDWAVAFLDLARPSKPKRLGELRLAKGWIGNVAISGDLLVACGDSTLATFDISHRTLPLILGSVELSCSALELAGSWAYVTTQEGELVTVDLATPAAPRVVDRQACVSYDEMARRIVLAAGTMWIDLARAYGEMVPLGDGDFEPINLGYSLADPGRPRLLSGVARSDWAPRSSLGMDLLAASPGGLIRVDVSSCSEAVALVPSIGLHRVVPAVGERVGFLDGTGPSPHSCRWDFGDGSSSNSCHPVHRYAHAGRYQAELLVSHGSERAVASRRIKVVPAPPPPKVAFEWSPKRPLPNQPVDFRSSIQGEIDDLRWQLGDGSISDQPELRHIYAKPGSYEVALAVGTQGGVATASHTISVDPPASRCRLAPPSRYRLQEDVPFETLIVDDLVVVLSTEGIAVLDVTDPSLPQRFPIEGSLVGKIGGIAVSRQPGAERLFYAANRKERSIVVVDLSDPATPAVIARVSLGFEPAQIEAAGRWLIVCATGEPGAILDLADPRSPTFCRRSFEFAFRGFASENEAIFNFWDRQIQVQNLSDSLLPKNVAVVSELGTSDGFTAIRDGILWAAGTYTDLTFWDVADPLAPLRIGALPPVHGIRAISFDGDRAWVLSESLGLSLFDISCASDPIYLDSRPLSDAYALSVQDGVAILMNHQSDELELYELGKCSARELGAR